MGKGPLEKRGNNFTIMFSEMFGWAGGEEKMVAANPNLGRNREKYQQIPRG